MNEPPERYLCIYAFVWENVTLQRFQQPITGAQFIFEDQRRKWEASATCAVFVALLRQLLSRRGELDGPARPSAAASKKVTKVVCFGLGDVTRNLSP